MNQLGTVREIRDAVQDGARTAVSVCETALTRIRSRDAALHAFARVTLPLIGPGLVTAAMIAFTAAAMSFVPAYILGSGKPTAKIIEEASDVLAFLGETLAFSSGRTGSMYRGRVSSGVPRSEI